MPKKLTPDKHPSNELSINPHMTDAAIDNQMMKAFLTYKSFAVLNLSLHVKKPGGDKKLIIHWIDWSFSSFSGAVEQSSSLITL